MIYFPRGEMMRIKRNALNLDDFSERLQETRKKVQPKQGEFAKEIGVAQNTLSCFENGSKQPSLDVLIILANALGVSTDFLLFGTETNVPKTAGDVARFIHKTSDQTTLLWNEAESLLELTIKDAPSELVSFCAKYFDNKSKASESGAKEMFDGWLESQFNKLDHIPLIAMHDTLIQFPTKEINRNDFAPTAKKEKKYVAESEYSSSQARPVALIACDSKKDKDQSAACTIAPLKSEDVMGGKRSKKKEPRSVAASMEEPELGVSVKRKEPREVACSMPREIGAETVGCAKIKKEEKSQAEEK